MPKDPKEFADLLGARIVGEVPDVGGGPFGMARLRASCTSASRPARESDRDGRRIRPGRADPRFP